MFAPAGPSAPSGAPSRLKSPLANYEKCYLTGPSRCAILWRGSRFGLARVASAGGTLDRIAGHAGSLLAKDVRLTVAVAEAAGLDVCASPVVGAADAALALMNVPR